MLGLVLKGDLHAFPELLFLAPVVDLAVSYERGLLLALRLRRTGVLPALPTLYSVG
jgi:hypothetical protein